MNDYEDHKEINALFAAERKRTDELIASNKFWTSWVGWEVALLASVLYFLMAFQVYPRIKALEARPAPAPAAPAPESGGARE